MSFKAMFIGQKNNEYDTPRSVGETPNDNSPEKFSISILSNSDNKLVGVDSKKD